MSRVTPMSPDEVRALPVTVDVPTAGRAWGLGPKVSYRLVRTGEFPVPVLRLGRRLVVSRAAVLAERGIPDNSEGRDSHPGPATTTTPPPNGAKTHDDTPIRLRAV